MFGTTVTEVKIISTRTTPTNAFPFCVAELQTCEGRHFLERVAHVFSILCVFEELSIGQDRRTAEAEMMMLYSGISQVYNKCQAARQQVAAN